jgi:hypothetical protein
MIMIIIIIILAEHHCHGTNIPDLYSGGPDFKPWPKFRLSRLRVLVSFLRVCMPYMEKF